MNYEITDDLFHIDDIFDILAVVQQLQRLNQAVLISVADVRLRVIEDIRVAVVFVITVDQRYVVIPPSETCGAASLTFPLRGIAGARCILRSRRRLVFRTALTGCRTFLLSSLRISGYFRSRLCRR